jgi:hypothetical protein
MQRVIQWVVPAALAVAGIVFMLWVFFLAEGSKGRHAWLVEQSCC